MPSSMEKTFTSYIGRTIENLSIVVFVPPWYEYLGINNVLKNNDLVDEQLDLRLFSYRFHKASYPELLSGILSIARKGRPVFWYPESLSDGYRGVGKQILTLFTNLRNMGVVFITRNYSLYRELLEIGYGGYEFRELGLGELYDEFGGKFDKDLLYYCEGNIGVLTLLGEYSLSNEIIQNYIFDYYGYLESGQRKIIYYLSTRTLGNKVSRIYGAETYVFMKRLMDKGIILKLGGKGNYLIRDPLIRLVIQDKVFGDKHYRVSGWLYLIIKMLLGVGKGKVIDTPTGRLFISTPIKFKWINDRCIRFLTMDERTYTMFYHDKLSTLDIAIDKFRDKDDIRILVVPFGVDGKRLIKIKNRKLMLFTPGLLYMLGGELKFPRQV